ncbi:3'-5' exonuclease [Bombilactobacillus thymidiniphilus]|uniref:3'-5' exonuclease n=1 Tax=Bombilactobacillus thymidiniphilus TaxID=2923363 RepID=A0ABY4PE82_9LACO|nr:3'-5' exonuclease [Bombilactobacillus thymidiniphilus]UQS83814.1 3'-5' exonuclease [Bombilactobacillus thymidiniphilus]
MNFIAMDFETANFQASSACSLAIALINNNQIIDTFYTLINPQQPFNRKNIAIHHISPKDVEDAPTFAQIWPHIAPLFDLNHLITAHNAAFDNRVLKATLTASNIKTPTYNCIDTLRTSRRFYPDLPNHKLNTVSQALNIDLKQHHNALFDTVACAEILLKTQAEYGWEQIQPLTKIVS